MTSIPSNSRNKVKVRELRAEEKEYAATYLNETDDNRDNAISEIKRWVVDNKLSSPTDDFFILRFLRPCKFNVEKTKVKLRNYLQERINLPKWYKNRDPFLPELQAFLNLGIFLPLRKLGDYGNVVILINMLHDPRKQELSDFFKVSTMIFDIIARDHVPLSLHGIQVFVDFGNINYGHALQIGPIILKNIVHAIQCYPMRSLMSAKLKERFHFYPRGAENVFEKVPADILPVEYGGTNQTIKELKEYWKETAENNRNWFADNDKF